MVVNPSNCKRFPINKIGDVVYITPLELTKGSHVKVSMMCDECDKIKDVVWHTYIRHYGNLSLDGIWYCRNCKRKKNLMEKYGVDNVFKLEEIKEKTKKTLLEKYGVDNPSKSEEIRGKVKKTNMEKYGNGCYMTTDDFKMKTKLTLEKYGVDNISQINSIRKKKKESWEKLSPKEKSEIHKKRIETNIERYGNK